MNSFQFCWLRERSNRISVLIIIKYDADADRVNIPIWTSIGAVLSGSDFWKLRTSCSVVNHRRSTRTPMNKQGKRCLKVRKILVELGKFWLFPRSIMNKQEEKYQKGRFWLTTIGIDSIELAKWLLLGKTVDAGNENLGNFEQGL